MKITSTTPLHKTPKDLREILLNNPEVSELWDKLTPLARNEWICWVTIVFCYRMSEVDRFAWR